MSKATGQERTQYNCCHIMGTNLSFALTFSPRMTLSLLATEKKSFSLLLRCNTNGNTEFIHSIIHNLLLPNSKHFTSEYTVRQACTDN